MIHGIRSNGKNHGVVNTKPSVVSKMLDIVEYAAKYDLRNVKILEPSAGEGIFAIEVIKRLYKSSKNFNFDFIQALDNIFLCELNDSIFNLLKSNITKTLKELGINDHNPNFIKGDFLQKKFDVKFNLIIGNPPYVRSENIPNYLQNIYQNSFSTFSRKSDLYIAFYEKSLSLLCKEGVLSFICSNRWLKNQYGRKLRALIGKYYKIKEIINLENALLFEEEVLGYPAITNILKSDSKIIPKFFELDDLSSFINFKVANTSFHGLNLKSPNWFAFQYTGALYERNLKSIINQNFQIGIGVATGRDSIFIGEKLIAAVESELLLPILTSKDVKGVNINWQGNYLLNPYTKNGSLIDLDKYPKAKSYFFLHKEELSKRHIAKKKNSIWYRTIDKVNPKLLYQAKVILPDISGNKFIHVDEGHFYPHHNLYYITGGTYTEMCLLAAILMSEFVYNQLLKVGNKMNGGYPRWQSQNLKKLLLPTLSSIPIDKKESLLTAYNNKDITMINKIITKQNISKFEVPEGQLSLFEAKFRYTN